MTEPRSVGFPLAAALLLTLWPTAGQAVPSGADDSTDQRPPAAQPRDSDEDDGQDDGYDDGQDDGYDDGQDDGYDDDASSLEHKKVPPPRKGFQLAVRVGFSYPLGDLRSGIPLDDGVGLNFPVIVDAGAKLTPHWFVGGYARVAMGIAGSRFVERCDAEGGLCLAINLSLGGMAQYHFLPAGSTNPWVGLGVGASAAIVGAYTDNDIYNLLGIAVDFAVVSAGVDFRLKRNFGLGPYAEFSAGTFVFTQERGRFAPLGAKDAAGAVSFAITAGIRLVVFP